MKRPTSLSLAIAVAMQIPVLAFSQALEKFGHWQIGTLPTGRPYAVTYPPQNDDMWLNELRIECVAGGRLEYVPVPKQEPLRALWIDNSFDQVTVANGRASGASAVRLSREFLETERQATEADPNTEWIVSLVINDQRRAGSQVNGRGFGQARRYLLANCKN